MYSNIFKKNTYVSTHIHAHIYVYVFVNIYIHIGRSLGYWYNRVFSASTSGQRMYATLPLV
jgi:hypothetical protein